MMRRRTTRKKIKGGGTERSESERLGREAVSSVSSIATECSSAF